jgi:hypothetical protein
MKIRALIGEQQTKFEQLFSGRMLLMRVQRHICQAGLVGFDHMIPVFRTPAFDEAFWTVERLLVELEREFETKKKLCDRDKQRRLDRRADRQVSA